MIPNCIKKAVFFTASSAILAKMYDEVDVHYTTKHADLRIRLRNSKANCASSQTGKNES